MRGRAAAERTIEYSVTLTGSTRVRPKIIAAPIESSTTRWKRDACRGRTYFPHIQPMYCETM